jgi:hypothetical protein
MQITPGAERTEGILNAAIHHRFDISPFGSVAFGSSIQRNVLGTLLRSLADAEWRYKDMFRLNNPLSGYYAAGTRIDGALDRIVRSWMSPSWSNGRTPCSVFSLADWVGGGGCWGGRGGCDAEDTEQVPG